MPIHPAMASKFHLLEGVSSFLELFENPALADRRRAFEEHPGYDAPPVATRMDEAPAPHAPVPPSAGPLGTLSPHWRLWRAGGRYSCRTPNTTTCEPPAKRSPRRLRWLAWTCARCRSRRCCTASSTCPATSSRSATPSTLSAVRSVRPGRPSADDYPAQTGGRCTLTTAERPPCTTASASFSTPGSSPGSDTVTPYAPPAARATPGRSASGSKLT